MRLRASFVFFLIVTILFSGCQQKPVVSNQVANSNTNSAGTNAQWDAYVAKFLDDYFVANPSFAVYSGKHEFDGKMPDWSEEGLKKEIARLKAERDKASAFKDEQLDERQRFERDYLIAQIDKDLFWRETADQPHKNPTFYSDALDPDVYVSRDYAPLDVRIKAYTAYAKNVPAALEQVKKNLKFPMAPTLIKIGKTTIGGLADFYEKDVPKVFEPVKDEQSQKDFKEANEAAAKAIKDFDKWLSEQEASKSGGFALGDKLFTRMLKATEGVEIDLAKLEEIAKQTCKKIWMR